MKKNPFGHLAPDSFGLSQELAAIMQSSFNKDVQLVLSKLCTLMANQDKLTDALEERVLRLETKLKENLGEGSNQ